MPLPIRRSLIGALGLYCLSLPVGFAQILPDLSGPVDRVLEERVVDQLERSVESQVERAGRDLAKGIEDSANTVPGKLGEVLSSAELAALPGITAAPPGREILLEQDGAWMVVANEWVLLVDEAGAAELERLGARIIEQTDLASGPDDLLVISLPADVPRRSAIEKRLAELGAESLDRNHVYRASAPAGPDGAVSRSRSGTSGSPGSRPRLGLIDTDVDETHSALGGLKFIESDFVAMGALRPQAHGTGVASILAGSLGEDGSAIRAASVFFLSEDGTTGATTASLVQALDWMLAEDVDIINFSLSGPPNKVLERMIARSQEQGVTIVAAVGNEGPAARPLYPAAYDGVIGVTAVGADGKVYRWANQGPYVDVAALGVNVDVARPGGGYKRDSGTSLSAPRISAWLATVLPAKAGPDAALSALRDAVRPEAGEGRDNTLGWGVLSAELSS